ncbi:MAG TPA: hypothetical protein VLR94_09660 [Acidobacteriota bacterium]|nr:hypothetical protein [Acidobacteriota bacterium]
MANAGVGQKILWFLYQKGLSGVAKPDFLLLTKFADIEWFKVAETLMKDNNLDGRSVILDQLLKPGLLKSHPKRNQFLKILGQFLSKGIIDERLRVAKFIEQNPTAFKTTDDPIFGPLMTAMRDSDTRIATTAERAIKLLRGEDPDSI